MSSAVRPTWYAGDDSWYGEAWTMLHPPYTLMVLSFVTIGALLSPHLSWVVLLGTLAAYFAALGVGAHFLDQLPGMGSRYVHHWPDRWLWAVGIVGVATGVGLGVLGTLLLQEPDLILLVVVQGVCAVGYPLAPIFGGVLHRDSVFAISWGSLPFLTSYYAQGGNISLVALITAGAFAAIAIVEIRASRKSREGRRLARNRQSPPSVAEPIDRGFRRFDAILVSLSVGTGLVAAFLLAARLLIGG